MHRKKNDVSENKLNRRQGINTYNHDELIARSERMYKPGDRETFDDLMRVEGVHPKRQLRAIASRTVSMVGGENDAVSSSYEQNERRGKEGK